MKILRGAEIVSNLFESTDISNGTSLSTSHGHDVIRDNSSSRQIDNFQARRSASIDRLHSAFSDRRGRPLYAGATSAYFPSPIAQDAPRSAIDMEPSWQPLKIAANQTSSACPRRPARLQLGNSPIAEDSSTSNGSNSSDPKYRLMDKDGICQVRRRHINDVVKSRVSDAFTSLVEMSWAYIMLLYLMTYVLSWLVFAVIWWLLAVSHGDTVHSPDDVNDGANWTSCVNHVTDFKSAFLFSVETQHTIGYGHRYIETECPLAYLFLMMQCSLGVLVQSLSFGVVFSKFSRPARRAQSLVFSQRAVICLRENRYQLVIRVTDTMASSQVISVNVSMFYIDKELANKGEAFEQSQRALRLSTNGSNGDQFLLMASWPIDIIHTIDDESPLWNVSGKQLRTQRFEIIVVLEGIVQSTGMTIQARTSYLPSEIMWSHRLFQVVAERLNENGELSVSYRHLNDVIPIEMPHYSAKEYKDRCSSGTNDVTITEVVRQASDHIHVQQAHPDLDTGRREMFDRICIKM